MSLLKGVAFHNGKKASDGLKGRLLESTLSGYMHTEMGRYMRQRRIIAMQVWGFFCYLTTVLMLITHSAVFFLTRLGTLQDLSEVCLHDIHFYPFHLIDKLIKLNCFVLRHLLILSTVVTLSLRLEDVGITLQSSGVFNELRVVKILRMLFCSWCLWKAIAGTKYHLVYLEGQSRVQFLMSEKIYICF